MEVYAYQHGLYPRSEKVVAATRSLDRGRAGSDAVDQAFREDLDAFIDVQRNAGLDFFSDGLLRWQDIFRPLLAAARAEAPHALVRWFDTNTFFREPELPGPPGTLQSADGILPDQSVPAPRVLTLPSPFMFSRAARTDRDRNVLMVELAERVLRPVIEAAVAAGCRLIHLEDPWLGYSGIAAQDWAPLGEALGALHQPPNASLAFHVYFGDAGPHIERLLQLPVDAIGVDLVETDVNELGSGWDKGLVAGVISGRSAILESPESTVEVAHHIAESVRPRALYLTSNTELAYLPTVVAQEKVRRLGEAARRVTKLVAV